MVEGLDGVVGAVEGEEKLYAGNQGEVVSSSRVSVGERESSDRLVMPPCVGVCER